MPRLHVGVLWWPHCRGCPGSMLSSVPAVVVTFFILMQKKNTFLVCKDVAFFGPQCGVKVAFDPKGGKCIWFSVVMRGMKTGWSV
jgi:hypothetical protein